MPQIISTSNPGYQNLINQGYTMDSAYGNQNETVRLLDPVSTPSAPATNTQPAPAVITAQPAQNHLNTVNNQVNDWTNQMAGQAGAGTQPSITQTGQGYQVRGAGDFYGTYAEAVAALNKTVNPTTGKDPNQGVIDKIDQTLEEKPLTAEEQKIRDKQSELEKLNSLWDETDQGFLDSLKQFQNGTFPLSPEEQAQITALQNLWLRQIEQQKAANKNYEGAITNAGIAAGRNRYAPEIESGNVQGAINKGLEKVSDMEMQAAASIAQLKDALLEKNYLKIKDLYDATSKIMARKAEVIQDTIDDVRQVIKDQQEARMDELKFSKEYGTALASTVYNLLGDDEAENARIIQEYATQYGIDPNLMLAAINEYELEANEIDFEKTTIGGIQYRIGYDRMGNEVSRTTLGKSGTGGGGGGGGSNTVAGVKLTATEKGYYNAVQDGDITLDEVPVQYRSNVRKAMEGLGETEPEDDAETRILNTLSTFESSGDRAKEIAAELYRAKYGIGTSIDFEYAYKEALRELAQGPGTGPVWRSKINKLIEEIENA